jgi:hypothetical protein
MRLEDASVFVTLETVPGMGAHDAMSGRDLSYVNSTQKQDWVGVVVCHLLFPNLSL